MRKLTLPKAHKLFLSYRRKSGYKEKTVKSNGKKLKRFYGYLTGIAGIGDVREVDKKTVTDFLTWLNEIVSERTGKLLAAHTKREIFSLVRSLFRCLYVEELILVNPVQNVSYNPGRRTTQREIFSGDEIKRFLDGIDERKPFGLRDKAMFELIYSSGLRAGDVSNLDVNDVDFETRMMLLKQGKFSKDRVVPITKVALVFVKKYLEARRRKSTILFTGQMGMRLSTAAINRRCRKWLEQSGVYRKGLCVHSIRHTTAVHLLSKGADLRYVQELLGHESIETTVTYTHDLHENIKRIYKSYHPRENLYYQEVDERYLERLMRFKDVLGRQKTISRKKLMIKRRYYERNREKILEKKREKKGLTKK